MSDPKIVFEHDGRYKKCIVIDGKSYILQSFANELTVKGNTLKGRGNEGFVNEFIRTCIELILDDKMFDIRAEYDKWYERIENKELTADQVCKRESINMGIEQYKNKIEAGQNRIATYEAALDADRSYVKGDTIVTWIEEPEPVLKEYKTKEDEWIIPKNTASYETIRLEENFNGNIYRHHYHSRLETAIRRFVVVIGLEKWYIMFPELNLRKNDRVKFLPVFGLEKFLDYYPDFKFRDKDLKKLSEDDKLLLKEYILKGKISDKYLQLTE